MNCRVQLFGFSPQHHHEAIRAIIETATNGQSGVATPGLIGRLPLPSR
jgi:hypothetical protein